MKSFKPLTLSLLFIYSTFFFTPVYAEPSNLSLLKNEIKTYYDSGAYSRELAEAIQQAHQYINQQITANKQSNHKKKLAIILDIDETSLSNYAKITQRDFVGNQQLIHEEIMAADLPALKPTLNLYQNLMAQGVNIFFVTGRYASEGEATKTNLLRAGYKNWSGLYLRPDNYQQASAIPFKAQARAAISKQGYTIVATIGDQFSDLLGGYAQKQFKLPNPFYYLP